MEKKIQKGICGICPYNCEVCIELEDDVIARVFADKEAPDGAVCPRGRKAAKIVYGNNRILYPMIRNGKKGTKCFRRATWEEALSVAAEGFEKCKERYGAESLASYSGASSLEDSLVEYGDEFFSYYGSPNDMNSGSICFVPSRVMGPQLSLGLYGYQISADIDNSKVIFVWGSNPETDSGKSLYSKLLELQRKGTIIVVIDPRSNKMTGIADYWVKIKPGTDGALLLALNKRIIENSEYDIEFVKKYTHGMALFQEELRKLSMEDLLEECGVSLVDFEKLCALFSMSMAESFLSYTGMEYQPSGVETIRMMYIAWGISGKLDVPGGMLISEGMKVAYNPSLQESPLPIGAKEYPLFHYYAERGQFGEFPRAVIEGKPYPIKGLLVYAASPLLSYPNRKLMEEAYSKLDIMVVIERTWSDECLWADVILPATTYYENLSYCYYKNRVRLRKRIIEPVGESKNDVFILHELAEKLGFGDKIPGTDEELLSRTFSEEEIEQLYENEYGIVRDAPKPVYKKYEKGLIREDREPGFPTPTGKLEIRSTILEKFGYEGLPSYVSPYEKKEYKYAMFTGARSKYRYNANGLNCDDLVKEGEKPCAEIDAGLAKEISVCEGELVEISTESGRIVLPVKIRPMAKGTVHLPIGGGGKFQSPVWRNICVNDLCDFCKRDQMSGFITCKSVGCNIKKIEREEKNEKEISSVMPGSCYSA